MTCPECQGPNIYVLETRRVNGKKYRRLVCRDCGERFFTVERLVDPAEGRAQLNLWHKERKRGNIV